MFTVKGRDALFKQSALKGIRSAQTSAKVWRPPGTAMNQAKVHHLFLKNNLI